ncbi:hypothetical protein BKA70DRAFT_1145523 [Coprinopsis sp. MPI-PUGE-AT-0042]|nr:hypothetical protein BKA70DRAFT_1145523 [Coprinopsis sp. MPI-PUGE-AT-0042]
MDDADLARAIALSLQDHGDGREVIDLQSDNEDDEEAEFQRQLQQALEASKADASHTSTSAAKGLSSAHAAAPVNPQESVSSIATQSNAQNTSVSSGALDWRAERAQLEKERLARQARMLQQQGRTGSSGSGTRRSSPDDSDDEDDDDDIRPAKRPNLGKAASSSNANNSDQIFLDGEIRQTANQFAQPRADGKPTFRLTEVLGNKQDLAFAIISSYSLDISWIYGFFDRDVPVILVTQSEGGKAGVHNVLPNWIQTTPYLPYGRGCQHMKFMLLFYKTGRLRVVISTANLAPYDWREIENTVWLQDIPKRSTLGSKQGPGDDFPGVLQYMLNGVNVAPALKIMADSVGILCSSRYLHQTLKLLQHAALPIKAIDDIRQGWDFSRVRAHLVVSLAGKHEGWPSVIKAGHPRLMIAVRKLGLRTMKGTKAKTLTLECQGSSLGNYTTQWLNEFHWSARGESAEDWLDTKKKEREKLPLPPVKIIYPSLKTVQDSALGELGGGTMFCRRNQWQGKNFPRSLFHDSRSKGGPVLMHSKMIIGLLRENQFNSSASAKGKGTQLAADTDSEEEEDDEIQIVEQNVGWAYIGSHNFTPSAWGTLSGSSFNPVLNITNYEVGVVFPLKNETQVNTVSCFQRPPKKYATGDLPWMQEESRVLQESFRS